MIEVRGIRRQFGDLVAVRDVSLEIARGELVALLGPSGSGKTTLLRIIAGLEAPDAGAVLLDGVDVTHVSPAARRIGFVFQHYALFRHMTVFENVAFGLRVLPRAKRPTQSAIEARVRQLLELVRLEGHAARRPHELSGGQRQRIALARALAVEPQVLLLDEPFGALDARVRAELRRWLRALHDELHVTSVFVTHDQEEALSVADRVAVLNDGRIEQVGTPDEVYARPASRFVYDFLGESNVLHEDARVAYARPHEVEVEREPGEGAFPVRVRGVRAWGAVVRVELVRDDARSAGDLVAEISRERHEALDLRVGERAHARVRRASFFPAAAREAPSDEASFKEDASDELRAHDDDISRWTDLRDWMGPLK